MNAFTRAPVDYPRQEKVLASVPIVLTPEERASVFLKWIEDQCVAQWPDGTHAVLAALIRGKVIG